MAPAKCFNTAVSMHVLLGDTTGNRNVNATDIGQNAGGADVSDEIGETLALVTLHQSSSDDHIRVYDLAVPVSECDAAFRVLIAYADTSAPTTLRNQILAEPGVAAVDLFDAEVGTPTLAQLQTYDVVVAFSNTTYADRIAMGDVLANYADTGGVVVGFNFNWHSAPFGLAGRWITGGYSPFNTNASNRFSNSTLGAFTAGHPLMQGVTTLNGFYRSSVTLAPGATQIAAWADSVPMIAVKTQNGRTGVGINNYVGDAPNEWSGEFGRVVINAARWLGPGGYSTATSGGNAIVPGTVDIGNHCDDCTTPITFPFPVTLYGTAYTTAIVSSNGNIQFTGNTAHRFRICPLPDPGLGKAIMAYQGDLLTNQPGNGIFYSFSGTAPNRIFNLEWRTNYFGRPGTANFEVRLFESGSTFEVIYGATADNGAQEESGVQESGVGPATQFSCDTATLTSGLKVTYRSCAPTVISAVSRKVHGAAGTFDIPLPLVALRGAVGIEDRTGPVAGEYQIVVTFPGPVTVGGVAVTSGTGSATYSTAGAVVTINLTGVTNAQRLGVTLANVNDGSVAGNVFVPMGVLAGDTNASGSVTSSDISQVKGQSGQAVTAGNFRTDVNVSGGTITSSDIGLVKSRSGTPLPP